MATTPFPPIPEYIGQFDVIDKNLYVPFLALCVALVVLLNTVVIAIIVLLLAKDRQLRETRLAKMLAVLGCCLIYLTDAAWPWALYTHNTRTDATVSCDANLSMWISSRALSSLRLLAVVVTIVTQVMSLVNVRQAWQIVVTVFCLLLAVVYSFAVVVPILYLKIVKDPENPCHSDGNIIVKGPEVYLHWIKVQSGLIYAPAVLIILAATVLFIMAIRTTGRSGQTAAGGPGHSKGEVTSADGNAQISASQKNAGRQPFPIDVLLAGVLTFVVLVPPFFYDIIWYNDDRDREFAWKFVTGLQFLYVFHLFLVPCCWLLGTEIRTGIAKLCCQRARGSAYGQDLATVAGP